MAKRQTSTRQVAIQQITDWRNVGLGTHYALIDGDKIIARALFGVTLADLQREYQTRRQYRELKAVRS